MQDFYHQELDPLGKAGSSDKTWRLMGLGDMREQVGVTHGCSARGLRLECASSPGGTSHARRHQAREREIHPNIEPQFLETGQISVFSHIARAEVVK